jgi:uncharacterized protein YkwD
VHDRQAADDGFVISRNLRGGLLPALLISLTLAVPAAAQPARSGPAGAPAQGRQAGPRCPGADLMPSSENVADVRDATLCLLNAQRTRRGLKPLQLSPQLNKSSQRFSQMMVRQSFFDHVSPGGSTLLSRVRHGTRYLRGVRSYALGENIAWGSGEYATASETVKSWMESSGHRSNILNRRFIHIGVGIAIGAPEDAQGVPAATYTTDFGYRR